MSDPGWAVQKAIFAALNGNVTWNGATVPVYDNAPQDAAYPYVSFDEQLSVEADYLAERKDDRTFYLSVWSNQPGKKQVLEIMAALDALLHRKRFTMDVGYMVTCYVARKSTQRDIDRVTYQGFVTLRIVTTH